MIRINQLKIPIDINKRNENRSDRGEDRAISVLRKKAAKTLRIDQSDIKEIQIVKHSIDARKKPELYDVYVVDVNIGGNAEDANGKGGAKGKGDANGKVGSKEAQVVKKCRDKNVALATEKKYDFYEKIGVRKTDAEGGIATANDKAISNDMATGRKVIIIGAGPAGLFCGYELAKHGYKPLILERGADVDKRSEIVEKFWNTGELSTRTNVQFGEGGAGTFSDGKLNTMVKDKEGRGAEALDIFVENGAPERIKYESKPHIGTDILKTVVKNIRNEIINCGGEVIFESKVTELVLGEKNELKALKTEDGKTYECDAAVLAIGHSARDTFGMLKEKKVDMQPKPFAVGFRVEHPQSLINISQYGVDAPEILPAAPYKLTTTTESGRGVYSFCMCPGGYVVNASSEEGMLAVNGMSYSARDGKNANSAIIITVDPKDFGSDDVLAGVEFQRNLEKKAFELAKGKIPVEYYGDFKAAVRGNVVKNAEDSWAPQMKGSYEFANVHEILPDDLNQAFVEGMENFNRYIKGYNDDRALVSGVESRTSSPVRINRDEFGESVNVKGLFPCGEGAGYAGGIMSAAMDGIRTAEMVAKSLAEFWTLY